MENAAGFPLFGCYTTCTAKAVVCGGMLAVIKSACLILTSWPGRSAPSLMGFPKRFVIVVVLVITNRVWLLMLLGLPVYRKLLAGSTYATGAVVTAEEDWDLLCTTIISAFD